MTHEYPYLDISPCGSLFFVVTFMCMLNIRNCYFDDVQGWGGDGMLTSCSGVGWDVNVHVHVTLMMFRGGVGWDVNVHDMCMLR